MSALTYINENEREVSLDDLAQTCSDLCEHIGALKIIAITNAKNMDKTCEETGLMMIFATSLTAINKRVFELKPRTE